MSGSEVWDVGPVSEDASFEVIDVLYAKSSWNAKGRTRRRNLSFDANAFKSKREREGLRPQWLNVQNANDRARNNYTTRKTIETWNWNEL